ncbi:hypothetical protein CEXT_661161 [Caerostris extrusa]|uniref:Uncharacterized protein n=1 Tax=Caerostris extrusa TaxID=172846 RepID=A0AAV4S6S1_CAEEX|nr:hypothetical protein CEXT_661161 [Caerostris extrusa]
MPNKSSGENCPGGVSYAMSSTRERICSISSKSLNVTLVHVLQISPQNEVIVSVQDGVIHRSLSQIRMMRPQRSLSQVRIMRPQRSLSQIRMVRPQRSLSQVRMR